MIFENLPPLPDDPIFGLLSAFQADPRPEKINLSAGVFIDEEGRVPLLESVKQAEKWLCAQEVPKTYLPIEGEAQFLMRARTLIFGEEFASSSITVQSLGGTGALSLGARFLKTQGIQNCYLPFPTWPNHIQIFQQAGFKIEHYPYYHFAKREIDLVGMEEALSNMAPKSVLLFQVCCHNPTGLDLNFSQWERIEKIVKAKELLPFFDAAYLGLRENFERDAAPLRLFGKKGHPMLVSGSFSKNLSLYGERVGILCLLQFSDSVLSHLRRLIRSSYSNPPRHGAQIATHIFATQALKQLWESELQLMRTRLNQMRQGLMQKVPHFASLLQHQKGLFFMTGFTPQQVSWLREEKGLYLLENGRLSLAGLTENNLDQVAEGIMAVLHEE